MIKDNGERTAFETGAVRDMHGDMNESKGRCDLVPWDSLKYIFDFDPAMTSFLTYLKWHDISDLKAAIILYAEETFCNTENALLELSVHFEQGAMKYGERNWEKGIPCHSYVDSGLRHYLKHKRGDTDERHDRACLWNMVCLLWTIENKPECNDLWKDENEG